MRLFGFSKTVTLFIIAICCICVLGAATLDQDKNVMAQANTNNFHVVIDAGHGGKDKGASSSNGTYESDINLAIAKYLGAECKTRGMSVTYTRTDHNSLASVLAKNKKLDDMRNRQKIIENAQPDLVISIHLNSFIADRTVKGLQCFYAPVSDKSRAYAEIVQHEFNKTQQHINRTAKSGDYFILNCSAYPSILIECGFLSNTQEEKLLSTKEYQRIIAYHIANAIASALPSSNSQNQI